jgi:hypothetical protein
LEKIETQSSQRHRGLRNLRGERAEERENGGVREFLASEHRDVEHRDGELDGYRANKT